MARIALAEREFILEQLEPVPVKLPIYTCVNGHYTDEIKKCPSCKSRVIRCTFLEDLLQKSSFNCPHPRCGKSIQGETLSEHVEYKCHYRPVQCSYGLCQRSFPFWTYFEHLVHGHLIQGNRSEDPLIFILLTPGDCRTEVSYKIWNNHTFLIWAKSTPTETRIWVQYFGIETAEKEFVATVFISGKKPHKTEIQFPVTSIRADLDSVQRKAAYAHLSTPALRKYLTGELLRVSVSIHNTMQINDERIYRLRNAKESGSPDSIC